MAIGLGLAIAVTLGWLLIASLLRAAPPWWRQVRVSEAQTQQIAQEVENSVVTLLHLSREGAASSSGSDGRSEGGLWRSEPWGVSIPASDANAWINARLPRWLETSGSDLRLPPEFRDAQVEFDDGRVWIGVAYRGSEAEGTSRVLSAGFVPSFDASGMLGLRLERVSIGRLPISRGMLHEVVERLDAGSDPEVLGAVRALLAGERVGVSPVLDLEDGRRVRITGLRARGGRLEVTCVTEHGGS